MDSPSSVATAFRSLGLSGYRSSAALTCLLRLSTSGMSATFMRRSSKTMITGQAPSLAIASREFCPSSRARAWATVSSLKISSPEFDGPCSSFPFGLNRKPYPMPFMTALPFRPRAYPCRKDPRLGQLVLDGAEQRRDLLGRVFVVLPVGQVPQNLDSP